MVDIIVKTVLDFIQGQEGYENSIVAGGCIRDHFLEITPNDYDIFVPLNGKFLDLKDSIGKEFGVDHFLDKTRTSDYGHQTDISEVNEFIFEGKKFDIIIKNYENDEDFGREVVGRFNYGYNMAYYDGVAIDDSHEFFQFDRGMYQMTLRTLEYMGQLPKAIEKYQNVNRRLNEIGKPNLIWDAHCLTMNKKEQPPKKKFNYGMYNLDRANVGEVRNDLMDRIPMWEQNPVEQRRPWARAGLAAGNVGAVRDLPDPWDNQPVQAVANNREDVFQVGMWEQALHNDMVFGNPVARPIVQGNPVELVIRDEAQEIAEWVDDQLDRDFPVR
ncbi:hypothetical protein SmphiM6_61 [Sinorhizobium phage phiM6]|nr:hypothetical protein SmphiM6_61 [Sinorhizobium phage phiM6]